MKALLCNACPHPDPLPREREQQRSISSLRKIVRQIQSLEVLCSGERFSLSLGGEGRGEGGRYY